PTFIMTRVPEALLDFTASILASEHSCCGRNLSFSALFPRGSRTKCREPAPSIDSLRSRRNEARPVSIEERAQRQERARVLMREQHIDAILLAQGTSLVYFA